MSQIEVRIEAQEPSRSASSTTQQFSLANFWFSKISKIRRRVVQFFQAKPSTCLPGNQNNAGKKQIEDYRLGYPRYAALIGSHPPFHFCRRFSQLRARMLLIKQDRLCHLEEQLERVDHDEEKELFLGSIRRDKNPVRTALVADINTALIEYDEMVERNYKILAREGARQQDVTSLENWVERTGCLSREETRYLAADDDLLCAVTTNDGVLVRLELLLERIIISCCTCIGRRPRIGISRDPNVYIFSGTILQRITRAFVAWIIVLLLLVPIVVINALSSASLRLCLIFVISAVVIMLLSILTKARTAELFIASATYATIMVVLISGNTTSIG